MTAEAGRVEVKGEKLFERRIEGIMFDWTFGSDGKGKAGLVLDINNVTYFRIPKPQADYVKSKGYKPNHQPTRLLIYEDGEGMHCNFTLVEGTEEKPR